MFIPFFPTLSNYIKSIPGFHTTRKIVVLESDDWGSIRMPSINVYNQMVRMGFDSQNRYNKFDSLATSDDLSKLFEVLSSVKDRSGNFCVMTPMCLVANPDFKKIEDANFHEYYYEPFTVTLKQYPGCERSFELWKEGIASGVFVPQFHGREHLNIVRWIRALKLGDKDTHLAFRYKFWGYLKRLDSYDSGKSYQAAFDIDTTADIDTFNISIMEGLALFTKLLEYRATCFTPPNGPLNFNNEKTTAGNGIKYIQTARVFYHEPIGNGKTRFRLRYLGKRNKYNQIYLIRNCFFEPSEKANFNWIDKCLYEIGVAFKNKQPAIISTHRVNYIGAISPDNRSNGLIQLRGLLGGITKKFSDVEFLTSPQLGDIITKDVFR